MEQKSFEFKNIFVELVNEDKKDDAKYVRILDGISGNFKSGTLTAVMGASGAGKSTLFDVLLGRIDNLTKTYGTILYNGKERVEGDWIHQVSYLKQIDIFFPKFSIMESIMYNLDFYKSKLSKKEKLAFAEEILRMSNIYDKRYAYVESLSGGECKRAMIALSLCADPEIIFMDEPTSGLDSHSALILINFMKSYAEKNNKIVVISLHQPGEALFNLFEDILYLGRGAVFYEGKVNNISNWLEEKGIIKHEGISLAEYLFELHSDNPYPPEIASTKPIVNQIIESNRQKYKDLRESIELKKGLSNLLVRSDISIKTMKTLWHRFFLNVWRTRKPIRTLVFNVMVICAAMFALIIYLMITIGYHVATARNPNCRFLEYLESVNAKMNDDGRNLIVNDVFLRGYSTYFSLALGYLNYDFYGDKDFISEDIMAGKYSTLTAFIANIVYDIISTLSWFIIVPLMLYLTQLRILLTSSFIPQIVLFATCYAIGRLFLRHICAGSTSTATYILSGCFIIASFSTVLLFDIVASMNATLLGWFKYVSYIYLFCPPIILLHIFKYREYLFLQSICDNPNYYFRNVSTFEVDLVKQTVFDFLRLSRLPPYWACYAILGLSISFNVLCSFYLFSAQLKNYLRLQLN